MWNFICNWLPVIAFLSGTALGGLLYYILYVREKEKRVENDIEHIKREKNQLQNDLVHHNTITETQTKNLAEQLHATKNEYENLSGKYSKTLVELSKINNKISKLETSKKGELNIENQSLRNKIQKLKKSKKPPKQENNYLTEYQSFLEELENTIRRAKQKAIAQSPSKNEKGWKEKISKKKKEVEKPLEKNFISKKKKAKKKKKKKEKGQDKYQLYQEKFAKEDLLRKSKPFLIDDLEFQTSRNKLTELYGIDDNIESILNKEGISTYAELSRTRIARLREILAFHGADFENIDPLNWPIQARIAEKGQWPILDEYKKRMNEGKS